MKNTISISLVLLACLSFFYAGYNYPKQAKNSKSNIIVFDSTVDTNDLNSSDVFRILARRGDTLVMTYYY